jgi:UDP-GlcNAc:undecaprenyl-phosphate GlcNAc-1-phosphate transferase
MTVYLSLVLTGAALGLLLTPLVASAASAFGLVDAPGGRKVHSVSVPRLGGFAIVVSAALALGVTTFISPQTLPEVESSFSTLAPMLIGAALVFGVGLVDDLRPLSPSQKLAIELVAALVVMASGLRIERITLIGQTFVLGLLAWPVTLIWIVGLTNAFNLIDGVDGLAAGVAVIAGSTCAVILVARGHQAEAMLLAAMVGAAVGFLAYNFAPAKIFLGDAGSLLFGFILATTAITGWQKGATALAAGVPILIFALPIADAGATLLRRIFGGQSTKGSFREVLRRIAQPDRLHIHHRLLAKGWSPRQTVALLYGLTLLFSAIALATVRFD